MTSAAQREAVEWIRERRPCSQRRACDLATACRSMVRYHRQEDPEEEQVVERVLELAGERPRFGYRRLHGLLRRDGTQINHKWVYWESRTRQSRV